ncbi:MAG TPA: hypothetical protein VGB04_03425 [Allosphingosinicella sp.]
MSKLKLILAAAAPGLLLAACSSQQPSTGLNDVAGVDANMSAEPVAADPALSVNAANAADDAGPPPDAVSHPNGFLPYGNSGAPEATETDATGNAVPPPATEDEYTRNGQGGR